MCEIYRKTVREREMTMVIIAFYIFENSVIYLKIEMVLIDGSFHMGELLSVLPSSATSALCRPSLVPLIWKKISACLAPILSAASRPTSYPRPRVMMVMLLRHKVIDKGA